MRIEQALSGIITRRTSLEIYQVLQAFVLCEQPAQISISGLAVIVNLDWDEYNP
jgi:hypothetical protein